MYIIYIYVSICSTSLHHMQTLVPASLSLSPYIYIMHVHELMCSSQQHMCAGYNTEIPSKISEANSAI